VLASLSAASPTGGHRPGDSRGALTLGTGPSIPISRADSLFVLVVMLTAGHMYMRKGSPDGLFPQPSLSSLPALYYKSD
jgi:hypothetical protein